MRKFFWCPCSEACTVKLNRTRSLQNWEASHCCLTLNVFLPFFCQEIAVSKGRSWALKETLLMIATLKSSPEGDLFGRNRSRPLSMFLKIPRCSCRPIIYKSNSPSAFLSGFCTVSCSSTMTAQTTVYLSRQRTTNCKSNLTSPFTSISGETIRYFLSPPSPTTMLSSFTAVPTITLIRQCFMFGSIGCLLF